MKPLVLLLIAPACLCAAGPLELKLWPDGAPGKMVPHSKATEEFIRTKAGKSTITDIHEPTITVYRPEKPNGTSVIVAPGGGYVFLSAVHEGTQVCEWLNSIGVTGILLKYRTPTRDEAAPHEKPVQDAARALEIVRQHAGAWKLDPKRVGLLGFSAGGNLLAHIACDRPAANHLPDFGVMVYGGGFVDPKNPTQLKAGFKVPANAPPIFIVCAHDDGQNAIASTVLYLEYKKQGIPAELHLFTRGGHGFGMRKAGNPINGWPQRCGEWLAGMGGLMTAEMLKAEIKKRAEALERIPRLIATLPCGNDAMNAAAQLSRDKGRLVQARAKGDQQAEKRAEADIKRAEAFLAELTKPVVKGINVETLSEDLHRLKKEKLELEAKWDELFGGLRPNNLETCQPPAHSG